MRFKLYLEMGPKRSLRAVVANEPDAKKATKKSTQNPKQNFSDVSVPGAWKRASKIWRWVDRAKAYDLDQIEKQAGIIHRLVEKEPFASKSYRLLRLFSMASALDEFSKKGLSLEECVTYTKLMQSLFKDIAHEMEGMDEHTKQVADAYALSHMVGQQNKQKAKS